MTAIAFDPTTGRLRLPATTFDGLADDDPRMADEFAAAGVRTARGLHPLLKPGMAAVRAPVCRIAVEEAGAFTVHRHRGWVSGEAASFLLQSKPDLHEFITLGPTFVPAGLAHLVRLGPRPRLRGIELPAGSVDALFDESDDIRTAEAERILAALSVEPPAAGWRASRTLVAWPGADGSTVGRELVLFDHPAGLLEVVAGADTGAVWAASSTTAVWARLVALLPGDSELGLAPDP